MVSEIDDMDGQSNDGGSARRIPAHPHELRTPLRESDPSVILPSRLIPPAVLDMATVREVVLKKHNKERSLELQSLHRASRRLSSICQLSTVSTQVVR